MLRGQSEIANCEEEQGEINEVAYMRKVARDTVPEEKTLGLFAAGRVHAHTQALRCPCRKRARNVVEYAVVRLVQCSVNSFVKYLCKMTARKSVKARYRQNSLALDSPRRVRISPDVSLQLLERSNLAIRVHLGMDPRLYGCDDVVLRSNMFSS